MSSKFIVPLKLLELNAVPALTTSDWHNLYYRQGYLKNYKSSEKDVVLDRPLDGFTPTVCLPIVATDTVLQAFEKLQCQITNLPPQVNADWLATSGVAEILNKPVLATVATTGNYNDLLNIPVIPPQVNADWNALSGPAFIFNKPTITPQVNADWLALSGPAFILNKPTISPQVIAVSGTTLYSTNPAAGPNFPTTNAIVFGNSAGANANFSNNSIFLGNLAGNNAPSCSDSYFTGNGAGRNASSCYSSFFIGTEAGMNASASYRTIAIGFRAAYDQDNSQESAFIGHGSGAGDNPFFPLSFNNGASTFIGTLAGNGCKNSPRTVSIGYGSTVGAQGNDYTVAIGFDAGARITSCLYNNLIGLQAGFGANSAQDNNYIGKYAGYDGDNNISCNFIGNRAGVSAKNITDSIFIGKRAGESSSGSNVIALGTDAAFTNTQSNRFIIANTHIPTFLDSTDAATNLAGAVPGTYLWVDLSTLSNGSYTVKAYRTP